MKKHIEYLKRVLDPKRVRVNDDGEIGVGTPTVSEIPSATLGMEVGDGKIVVMNHEQYEVFNYPELCPFCGTFNVYHMIPLNRGGPTHGCSKCHATWKPRLVVRDEEGKEYNASSKDGKLYLSPTESNGPWSRFKKNQRLSLRKSK